MNKHDETYHAALEEILIKGKRKDDRTGTGTKSRFGMQMRFDLRKHGFPLVTTKKTHFKSIIWELLWFLRGGTNVKWLQERGVSIWDEWADEHGHLGPVYGAQWRNWPEGTPGYGYDQLATVVQTLKDNPDDRRMIVSAWNVGQLPFMRLPPCHLLFQFWVWRNQIHCQLYQRSCDMFLGVPFNIASYSALIHLLAHVCDMEVGEFIWTGGDCHIYNNHMEQVELQLSRAPFKAPTLTIAPDAPKSIDGEWHLDHFQLEGYECHPGIKAPVAI
jgi:thymidylate synthase